MTIWQINAQGSQRLGKSGWYLDLSGLPNPRPRFTATSLPTYTVYENDLDTAGMRE